MKNNLYTVKGAIIWFTGRPAAGKTTLCMNTGNIGVRPCVQLRVYSPVGGNPIK